MRASSNNDGAQLSERRLVMGVSAYFEMSMQPRWERSAQKRRLSFQIEFLVLE